MENGDGCAGRAWATEATRLPPPDDPDD